MKPKREIKRLESLLEQLATLQTELARSEIGVEQYQIASQRLQHRYRELTGKYYHIVKEDRMVEEKEK